MDVDVLPPEVAIEIVALLPAQDLCVLGLCSRSLHRLCTSDEVWKILYNRRWPATVAVTPVGAEPGSGDADIAEGARVVVEAGGGWRAAYRWRAARVAEQAGRLVSHVRCRLCHDSLEIFTYHDALALLRRSQLQFGDVAAALLDPKHSVLVALVAVHYACLTLAVPGPEVAAALEGAGSAERQVCLRWWSMGSMGRGGFRLRDDMRTATLTLRDIAAGGDASRGGWLLPLLERGKVHEILRIQISADFNSSAWVGRVIYSQH